ncbi:unnamed protein product [Musa textilis]
MKPFNIIIVIQFLFIFKENNGMMTYVCSSKKFQVNKRLEDGRSAKKCWKTKGVIKKNCQRISLVYEIGKKKKISVNSYFVSFIIYCGDARFTILYVHCLHLVTLYIQILYTTYNSCCD